MLCRQITTQLSAGGDINVVLAGNHTIIDLVICFSSYVVIYIFNIIERKKRPKFLKFLICLCSFFVAVTLMKT
jgi:hypothetical protein